MRFQLPNYIAMPPGETLAHESIEVQRKLNSFYLRECSSANAFMTFPKWEQYEEIHAIEHAWNMHDESLISFDALPKTASEFERWYSSLFREHRAAVAPFFEYLAQDATLDELALYISMEEQVDSRFDDVIALAQIGLCGDMKLALAENYWDEMGLGKVENMHTNLFRLSSEHMKSLSAVAITQDTIPAHAYKNGNLLLMYALRRQYSARLLGALTILEHSAPYRFSMTVKGLRRLGVSESAVYYHELHIAVDANHGKQMFHRVLLPLISDSSAALQEICIGCLIRFRVATDYYNSLTNIFQKHPLQGNSHD